MGHPISVRLNDDVQADLESAARARGIGLSTYLKELAEAEIRRLRRQRLLTQSRTVGEHAATDPEARAFYEDWGKPS